ncbi:uncharacterized protein PAC_12473 [Phialocephala subalpina]|uniref:Uncharacterized protein n=1 Tax=Phialocephala subalpina TaxID=576137 RepID=A0A1L7XC46_9HELO|nr:uncharacterized protein PAC_12473 [Phialocephala subalpina]
MPLKFYDAFRDSILKGVHQQNFKNGAFKNTITASTPVVEMMNILISSSHLNPSQKDMVKTCRKSFIAIRKKYPGDQMPDLLDVFAITQASEPLWKMFKGDAQVRGVYVPPTTMQVMNKDGSVAKTITISEDGPDGFSAVETEGGVAGIPTGAPKEFVEKNMAKGNAVWDQLKNSDAKMMTANYFDPSSVAPTTEKEDPNSADAEKDAKIKDKKPKRDDKTDFGKGFARNLRGAFM